MPSLLFYVHL